MMKQQELFKRSQAALYGVAVGDALGKMTEGYWPQEIVEAYGGAITGFRKPIQPRSRFEWSYAEVTDDTQFTVLVADSIIARGKVERFDIARRILAEPIKGWPGWEEFKAANNPERVGHRTGNGAPMRITPVGIINSPKNIAKLIDDVEQACTMTHHVSSAISAACAIAAAVSAAMERWPKDEILELALEAARRGRSRGLKDQAPPIEQLVRLELWKLIMEDKPSSGWRLRGLNPGFAAWEGASFALCLAFCSSGAREAILEAANQGGDADSIAAMAGGIAAAIEPDSLPEEWIAEVERVNSLKLGRIAKNLVALRC